MDHPDDAQSRPPGPDDCLSKLLEQRRAYWRRRNRELVKEHPILFRLAQAYVFCVINARGFLAFALGVAAGYLLAQL